MYDIPFLKPALVKKESYLDYLDQIEESHLYTNYGPLNTRFEQRILDEHFNGVGAVTTVNNATIGLMIAIAHCKRPQGRYALMPSFTFAATAQAALWCGLTPYFLDIRPGDLCLEEERVAQALEELGDEVAVVVPYAAFGSDLDLSYYAKLHESGIPVVLDAASSFGTRTGQGQSGLGFPGYVIYSFHATKTFGIGEGGLIYSTDAAGIQAIRRSGNFGFSAARESTMLGLNSKLSEYGAAIGLATLDAFGDKCSKRHEVYRWYREELERTGLLEQGWELQEASGKVAFQNMTVFCPRGESNTGYLERLEQQKIQARTYFSPACHQQELFRSCPSGRLDVTEDKCQRVLSLPLWEDMERAHVTRIVEGLVTAR